MAVFGFDAKIAEARGNRSLAVNSKNAVVKAREDLLKEDDYNNKYLHGDTLGNIGINDLIWYWLYERGMEGGVYYIRPPLNNNLNNWRTDYDSVMEASLEPTGDRYIPRFSHNLSGFYRVPDTRYLNGFYPPNYNGIAAEELNFATDYLNWNGDTRPGDSTGFLFHLLALFETVGDSQSSPGDSIVSEYSYSGSSNASQAAETYLYGSSFFITKGTQIGKTKLGWGLIGRRSADPDITVQSSGIDYRYVIGDDTINEPNFYGDSIADVNSLLGTIPFKTNFLGTLYNVCQFGDTNTTYATHLKSLKIELEKIEGDSNPLFLEPDITGDIGDSSGAVEDLLNKLVTIVGDSGDTYYAGGDTTLWGLYSFFSDAGTDGTEGIFDTALLKTKEFGDSLRLTIINRYNSYTSIIGNTYTSAETDFTGMRKWRTFWVKTRIFKPKSTLLSYDALGSSVTDAERQVTNANEQLTTLYGDSNYHHYSYIQKPLVLASFYDPKLDQDDGTVLQKKIAVIYDGQQHATEYKIYRKEYYFGDTYSITNITWGDTYHYDTFKGINEDTGFIKNEYTDYGKITYAGDSIPDNSELFLYKTNLLSLPNEREGDTATGVSIEPARFLYKDLNAGDSELIINPRAKYWAGFDAGGATGLVAYYPLNENTRDYSGNGQHGILTAGTGEYKTGYINECYHFDGNSENIQLPTNMGTFTTISISVWVNVDTLSPSDINNRIVELQNSSGDVIRVFKDTNDKISIQYYNGTYYNALANDAMKTNTWYHIVGTYDGKTFYLYINGILQTDTGVISSISITPNQNAIGSAGNVSTNNNWDGKIDEVRIYNRALTQAEITGIYNTRKMLNPWSSITGFWKGTTNVLNYPDMIGDSVGYNSNINYALYPDNVAGTEYIQDEFATVDGWGGADGASAPTVSDEKLIWVDDAGGYLRKTAIGSIRNKLTFVRARITGGTGTAIHFRHGVGGNLYQANTLAASAEWKTYVIQVLDDYAYDSLFIAVDNSTTTTNSTLEIDYIYIGTGAYDAADFNGLWFMRPHDTGDTVELTNYYFNNKRFSKITTVTNNSSVRQIIQPGKFGDTLGKSYSSILKKGSGDTSSLYFIKNINLTEYVKVLVYWNNLTAKTYIGDTSKTNVEWFTNEIVRISGTSNPIGDTGDTFQFIIEPQESGVGTVYATAVQLEESTYPTPYVNGTREKSTYFFEKNMPRSGTISCWVRGRQPFDDSTGGSDVFFEWGNDNTHRIALAWPWSNHAWQVYYHNGGTGRNLLNGDTGGDTYYHQWHHFKFLWNFGDTSLDNCKLIIDGNNGDSGDTTWDGIPDAYYGDTDVFTDFAIGSRITGGAFAQFGGEVTDLLIQDTTGDSGDTHYINRVPWFYPDPFPTGTNYIYRVQTIDTLNPVNGNITKSFQSNLFDSSLGQTWNAISGDSILELGDSHDYRPDEYVVVDETTNSDGYYILTRVEDERIFISPSLTAGDITGKVYPTTSVVFIQE